MIRTGNHCLAKEFQAVLKREAALGQDEIAFCYELANNESAVRRFRPSTPGR